jgi:hypothetical protein
MPVVHAEDGHNGLPDRGVPRSRSFHFVLIDEAFGRGSDESTRYGPELFRQLNLQLLIVTPCRKFTRSSLLSPQSFCQFAPAPLGPRHERESLCLPNA